MKRIILMIMALIGLAGSVWAAKPSITLTTIWPDTAFAGPYTIRTVITCDDGLEYVGLGFRFNPTNGTNMWPWDGGTTDSWIDNPAEYTQVGDTFYFDIPAIPQGMETPVTIGYCIQAWSTGWADSTEVPGNRNYYSFLNDIFTPSFSNVSTLRDTFSTGPYVVRANLTTAFGDSVTNDFINSDLGSGGNYFRDSVGVDGFYYYSIPKLISNSATPINVQWFLSATDTMGNWGEYPIKRDSMNHFNFIDPMPSNTKVLGNTEQAGPFVVWTTYKAEGTVINDSLWVYNSGTSNWDPFARDSMKSDVYYYTLPQQQQAVVTPVFVQWYLKATDSINGNYTFVPATTGIGVPFSFRILDLTVPAITNVTKMVNTSFSGPFEITANCSDTSGIGQVRVNFRTKPLADTTWSYLPMYATGNPDEYKASLPVQYPGTIIQYYISAYDGALTAAGTAQKNTAYSPEGGQLTPYHFYVGSPDYKLLLVNDGLNETEYNNYYSACLDSNGVISGYWDNRKASVLTQLGNFNTMIWFTGDDSINTLGQTERDSLAAFLDRGGNLLLSSKNLGQNLGGKVNSDTVVFYHDYLKAQFDSFTVASTALNFQGRAALPISRGPSDSLNTGTVNTAGNYKSIDRISPLAGADSVFNVKGFNSCSVIRCSTATYKAIYASLPIEALTTNTPGRLSRTKFIGRCLNWFGIQTFYKVAGEAVSEAGLVNDVALLYQAFPNPFSSNTTISFSLPASGNVSLKVYNVAGQLVKTICDEQRPAGVQKITWNGNDEYGNKVSNGIYLYRLVTKDQNQTKKVIVLR